ncbi:MAG TPA: hypothetical protein VE569_04835 [Acidimicrobiia bacterium]|nr:hypothetical protein [Acidimicrobiia bacterium]
MLSDYCWVRNRHSQPPRTASPGEIRTLTWTFTEADTVLIGCHEPGHYLAGMKATINVEA